MQELTSVADAVLPYMDRVWKVLDDQRKAGARILFEGAQGTLLDIDHGTYPFVTSSNTVSGQAASGSGVGPGTIGYVLGITKAYTTRVGEGPFPTEQDNEVGDFLGTRGHEFGTVTGRKRRCGWFDAVLVRQAVAVNGIKGIALTKLDVLDGLDEIKVCVRYRLDGAEIDYLPASQGAQRRVEPVYETLEGWKGTTGGARSWNDLPAQAVKYVRYIEELIGAPVCSFVDKPRTGRHDTCDRPLSRLTWTPRICAASATIAPPASLTSRSIDGGFRSGSEENAGRAERHQPCHARTRLREGAQHDRRQARRDEPAAFGCRRGSPEACSRRRHRTGGARLCAATSACAGLGPAGRTRERLPPR